MVRGYGAGGIQRSAERDLQSTLSPFILALSNKSRIAEDIVLRVKGRTQIVGDDERRQHKEKMLKEGASKTIKALKKTSVQASKSNEQRDRG